MGHLTLFQLNSIIKNALNTQLEPSYWVIAEIGELKLNQKGHCYLELVEKEGDIISAKNKATIWAYTYRNISGWFESVTGKSLQPGMKVLAQVQVSFHELYGLSLNIKDIDPNFTLGERALKRQMVISQLKEEGVFNMNKELFLPLAPQRIAVISSPSSAGFEDFLVQLNTNKHRYKFNITLFKAIMQGSEAKDSIIKALYEIHKGVSGYDLVVIIRGGGAQVDLDCYDTYGLASHVAQFPLPVITGIGHERDETIVDLVAHTKLKTPTAVAEFLISGLRAFEEKLDFLLSRLHYYYEGKVKEESFKLNNLLQRLKYNSKSQLSEERHHLKKISSSLDYISKSLLNRQNQAISYLQSKLLDCTKRNLKSELRKLNNMEKNLLLLHPETILKRGFTITRINNTPLNKVQFIEEGDVVSTESYDRFITSKITNIASRNDEAISVENEELKNEELKR